METELGDGRRSQKGLLRETKKKKKNLLLNFAKGQLQPKAQKEAITFYRNEFAKQQEQEKSVINTQQTS